MPLPISCPAKRYRLWRFQSQTGLGARDPKRTSVPPLRGVDLEGAVPIACTTKYLSASMQALGGPSCVPLAILAAVVTVKSLSTH